MSYTALVELSHPIHPGMPVYPGISPAKLTSKMTSPAGEVLPSVERASFLMTGFDLPGNTGTYIDAPCHRHQDRASLAEISLEKLANLPGVIIAAPAEGPIELDALDKPIDGKAVLLRTGWSKNWGAGDYFRSGPYLTASAAEFLAQGNATLVGIDCANIDNMDDPVRPAHTILLRHDIPIVEHLQGLEQIPETAPFRFFAVPPRLRGAASFPVRAFALIELNGGDPDAKE